jgi:hypothetical protein
VLPHYIGEIDLAEAGILLSTSPLLGGAKEALLPHEQPAFGLGQ